MTAIKERILGAVSVMSDADAKNNPDCKEFISSEEAMKELGLY